LIKAITALADGREFIWAIDHAGAAALPITLLIAAEQQLLYFPGCIVYTLRSATAVIADQVRMKRYLRTLWRSPGPSPPTSQSYRATSVRACSW
jgi:hypothetical protein